MNNFLRNLLGLNKIDQESGKFENAISWEPAQPRHTDTLNIHYRGLLKDSGASEVYLHYGFDSWNRSINTVKMEKQDDGSFYKEIKAEEAQEMNLCFKDGENHWDNNHGHNWNLHFHEHP